MEALGLPVTDTWDCLSVLWHPGHHALSLGLHKRTRSPVFVSFCLCVHVFLSVHMHMYTMCVSRPETNCQPVLFKQYFSLTEKSLTSLD